VVLTRALSLWEDLLSLWEDLLSLWEDLLSLSEVLLSLSEVLLSLSEVLLSQLLEVMVAKMLSRVGGGEHKVHCHDVTCFK
jgi:hypothetical protein